MEESLEDRLAGLEKEVDKLKKKPKDGWEKFQIVAALLIPASITLAGYWYTEASKAAEIRSSEATAAQQRESAQAQARVGQAQLISTFMEALLSDTPQKRLLAIEVVQYALPEEGPRLLQIISKDASNPTVQKAALSSLDTRRAQLIADCFNDDSVTRKKAVADLIQGWLGDDKLVSELVQVASANKSNGSGVVDALVVLENVSPAVLAAHQDEIGAFLDLVRSNGPQTASHVVILENKLKTAH